MQREKSRSKLQKNGKISGGRLAAKSRVQLRLSEFEKSTIRISGGRLAAKSRVQVPVSKLQKTTVKFLVAV